MTINKFSTLSLLSAFALMGVAIWMVFFWVPTEANQGAIQRILYLHVPVAWASMSAIVVVAFASVMYLVTKKNRWDRIALSTAEVGVLFGVLMLLSGMIWARPVWGVWWTGEAKLTTALILVLIYVAYLMFRSYFPPGAQRQRIAASIAIIGALDTPIIYFGAQIWERAHPRAVIGPIADEGSAFAGEFGITLLVATCAFTLLLVSIVYERYRQKASEESIVEIQGFAHAMERNPA